MLTRPGSAGATSVVVRFGYINGKMKMPANTEKAPRAPGEP